MPSPKLLNGGSPVAYHVGSTIISRLPSHAAAAPTTQVGAAVTYHPLTTPVVAKGVVTRADSTLANTSPARITLTPRASTPTIPGTVGVISNLVQSPVLTKPIPAINPSLGIVPNQGTPGHIPIDMLSYRQDSPSLSVPNNLVANAMAQQASQTLSRSTMQTIDPAITNYTNLDTTTLLIVGALIFFLMFWKR